MERTRFLCLLADVRNYRTYFISLLEKYGFHIDYRNKTIIGFSNEKYGAFDLIFRDINSKNDDLYKYVKKGVKAFCHKHYFLDTKDIKRLYKDKMGYYVSSYEGSTEYRLPIYVMNTSNPDELFAYLFDNVTTTYYIGNFKNGVFDGTYTELPFIIKPVDIEGYETKELALVAALETMRKSIVSCTNRIATNKRTIESYEKHIEMYKNEIVRMENAISSLNDCLEKYEPTISVTPKEKINHAYRSLHASK